MPETITHALATVPEEDCFSLSISLCLLCLMLYRSARRIFVSTCTSASYLRPLRPCRYQTPSRAFAKPCTPQDDGDRFQSQRIALVSDIAGARASPQRGVGRRAPARLPGWRIGRERRRPAPRPRGRSSLLPGSPHAARREAACGVPPWPPHPALSRRAQEFCARAPRSTAATYRRRK